MKSITTVLAILTAATLFGLVSMGMQQVYGPRNCPSCGEFKALSHDFIKEVIEAWGNPDQKSRLLDEYVSDVRALWERESPPPEPE